MQPLLSRIIHGNLAPDQLWPEHFDGICQSEKIIIPPLLLPSSGKIGAADDLCQCFQVRDLMSTPKVSYFSGSVNFPVNLFSISSSMWSTIKAGNLPKFAEPLLPPSLHLLILLWNEGHVGLIRKVAPKENLGNAFQLNNLVSELIFY